MWEIPSFIGHSEKKKKFNGVNTISDKLPIEREADLRQKKKKILQRLKHRSEPEAPCDEHNSHSRSTISASEELISGVQESGVFEGEQKPGLFSQKIGASQSIKLIQSESLTLGQDEKQRKLEATSNERVAKGNHKVSRIPIPSPCASPPRTHMKSFYGKNMERRTPGLESGRNECYIPSFSSESLKKSDHNKRVSMIKQTVSKRNEEMSKKRLNSRDSAQDVCENLTKSNFRTIHPPLINIEHTATPSTDTHPNGGSNSPETRRTSVSKQTISSTNLYIESETDAFMSKSLTTLREDDSNVSRSLPLSPALARKQQTKLEEDFKRVEANLDQTFNELRKYLRTS